GQVLDHVDDGLHDIAQLGGLAAALAAAAEVEQTLNDLLAAKRLFLNHLEVLGDDAAVIDADAGARIGKQILQTALEPLAAKRDAGERIVDFVGDAGGEEADAGQPLRAHELPAALGDFVRQLAVHLAQAARHAVERLG